MTGPKGTGAGLVAAVAIVAALLGGAAALALGRVSGLLDRTETVVIETAPETPRQASVQPQGPIPADGFDPAAIYRERSPGVVTVYSLFPGHAEGDATAQAQGSGFLVSPDGYILTNSHVITTAGESAAGGPVDAAEQVLVEFRDGDRVEAEIVGWDLFDDVGLVKVDPGEHELAPVPLGDSSTAVVGEPVAAIGSPFGQDSSLAVGVISATQRAVSSLTSVYTVVDAIQTDAPINRGNSGGPLFNARGEVIGINAQIRSDSGNAQGVGFAIPINAAKRSMEELIATGEVRYAWVGVSTQTLTPSVAEELGIDASGGAAVQEVVAGSPAAGAGLRAGGELRRIDGFEFRAGGDVVVAIDGEQVETTEDLIRIVTERLEPGQRVGVTVLRDGERVGLRLELGERPLDPDAGR